MKYKAGDKFIIEIDKKFKSDLDRDGIRILYRIKGFKSLVFDDNGLDRLEQVHEHDGCDGCEYVSKSINAYPCYDCKRNYKDKWTPKTEEIQVGDEVEHDDGVKAVVYQIAGDCIYGLRKKEGGTIIKVLWGRRVCTRTGKTYPGLIKALEELPTEEE